MLGVVTGVERALARPGRNPARPCRHPLPAHQGSDRRHLEALYEEGERDWGDVDILLPPSGMDRALEVLLASGFSHRDPGLRWRTSEDHALTLWHDPDGRATHGAAAEVDVHHRFQGMEGDPERVFAELWRRREPAQLGGLDVWFPDLPSRSLILVAQRGARPARGPRPRRTCAVSSRWRRTPTGAHHRPGATRRRPAGPAGRDRDRARRSRPRGAYPAGRRRGVGRVAAARPGVHADRRPDRGAAQPGRRRQGPHFGGLGRAVPRRDPLPRPASGRQHLAAPAGVRRPLPPGRGRPAAVRARAPGRAPPADAASCPPTRSPPPEPVREGASERPTVTEAATAPAPASPLAAPDGQVGTGLLDAARRGRRTI